MSAPFIRYDCDTVGHPVEVEIGDVTAKIPAGGFICDVFTNDNRERGTGADDASWKTWAKDRPGFDRIVGKSRQGVGMRCDVYLDGERI